MVARQLDLADIQGNILRPYGRQGFPKARYIFLHIKNSDAGRRFVEIVRPRITTAVRWESKAHYPGEVIVPRPAVAVNIAFTWYGLLALGLPTSTLGAFPSEFIDGMANRCEILGDDGPNHKRNWDPIWLHSEGDRRVHICVTLNAQMNPDGTPVAALESASAWLNEQCRLLGDQVVVLTGHGADGAGAYQEASAILDRKPDGSYQPTAKEFFGYTDGFGDPVFDGQFPQDVIGLRAIGSGAIEPDQSWRPLATGEFLLGYPDEAQEIADRPTPDEFTRNGTFTAYRKLHQNVASFRTYVRETANVYGSLMQVAEGEARDTLMAKLIGRWPDGVPLMAAPTFADWQAFAARAAGIPKVGHRKRQEDALARRYVDFKYADDPDGIKCPVAAHLRRANPRDMLDPTFRAGEPATWNGSVLNNRRRILRRGLPYGTLDPDRPTDDGEHGIIFMATCASLFRQFEFVQQQWMQYGLDFNAGNDTCPVIGNHDADAKFVIPAAPNSGKPPFFCPRLPQFVETRGGDYFFIPSMNALRMIEMGTIDPT